MSELHDLIAQILQFRDERDWKQFHNPKDISISLCLEAAEVLEHFQWKSPAEVEVYCQEHRAEIGSELADVLCFVLILSHELKVDLTEAFNLKMEENKRKYPVDKAKGNHVKYSKL